MTREEIIQEYEGTVVANGLAAAAGNEDAMKSYELFKAGLDALRPVSREQVEKVWRGEVELVRHAHWENTGGNEKVGLAYGTCSHCHREAWANYELTPRCPYCGAHMDEVKS